MIRTPSAVSRRIVQDYEFVASDAGFDYDVLLLYASRITNQLVVRVCAAGENIAKSVK